MIPRRTPLKAKTGLHRGKPLERKTALTARKPLEAKSAPMAGRHRAGSKPPRDTGPDARTRATVLVRDGYQCVRCGRVAGPAIGPYSIQHRIARGVGGGNGPQNLILLCGTATSPDGCHALAESRDREAQAHGYWLESWQNPLTEGVLYASEHGSGVLMYLDGEGGLSPDAPAGAA